MRLNRTGLLLIAMSGLLVGCNRGTPPPKVQDVEVSRGAINVEVVETGGIEAVRVVEVKSRVAGRVETLNVEDGDVVEAGQLIAVIDPKEVRLQIDQNRAQLNGAQSNVARTSVEIEQRAITARTTLAQARLRVAQLEKELKAQPTLTRSNIRSAEAAVQSARVAKSQLVESTQPNERTTLNAELSQATDTLTQARRQLERVESLFKQDFVSAREVETAKLEVQIAQSRQLSAQQRVNRLADQHAAELRTADTRIQQAEADLTRAKANSIQDDLKLREYQTAQSQVEAARAALKDVEALQYSRASGQATVQQLRSVLSDAERQLGETEIRAPFGGMITAKLVQEGELVSSISSFSNGSPIVRLEDRSSMLVKLNINEIDVAKLKVGMPATITVDALPGKKFKGQVSKISPARSVAAAGDAVVRYSVEVRLDNVDSEIKSGMTATCRMEVVSASNVLSIPIDYLLEEDGKTYVMVKETDPKSKGKKTEVEVGRRSGSRVELRNGVSQGTKLVRPNYSGPPRRGFGAEVE